MAKHKAKQIACGPLEGFEPIETKDVPIKWIDVFQAFEESSWTAIGKTYPDKRTANEEYERAYSSFARVRSRFGFKMRKRGNSILLVKEDGKGVL